CVLVDLRPNFLYSRAITGMEGREAVYVAPEVRSGTDDMARADLFSMGQLLIAFAGATPNGDGVVPDVFYARTPMLARFLEDLLSREPARRLLVMGHTGDVSYTHLRQVFVDEVATAAATESVGRPASRPIALVRELARDLLSPVNGE